MRAFKWIGEGRKALGLSQKDLAEILGTNTSYISQWETGKKRLTPEEEERLRGVFAEGLEGARRDPEKPQKAPAWVAVQIGG